MEAKLVDALPVEAGWQFEPKWDGFRAIASRLGEHEGRLAGCLADGLTAALWAEH
jgi:ATP-dependent DNA ligase